MPQIKFKLNDDCSKFRQCLFLIFLEQIRKHCVAFHFPQPIFFHLSQFCDEDKVTLFNRNPVPNPMKGIQGSRSWRLNGQHFFCGIGLVPKCSQGRFIDSKMNQCCKSELSCRCCCWSSTLDICQKCCCCCSIVCHMRCWWSCSLDICPKCCCCCCCCSDVCQIWRFVLERLLPDLAETDCGVEAVEDGKGHGDVGDDRPGPLPAVKSNLKQNRLTSNLEFRGKTFYLYTLPILSLRTA